MFTSLFYSFPRQLFFGDVINMWEMSFVFKNECMYGLDHQSYKMILKIKSLTIIFEVAGYFSTECVKSLEEQTQKKTGNKLVPFHIRSQMTQMHRGSFEVRVFYLNDAALDQVESTATTKLFSGFLIPSVITRNHVAWNMVSVILFFRLFILFKLFCQSSSLYI